MKHLITIGTLALVMTWLGCDRKHSHGSHSHHHDAPHGGTVLELGAEECFLEFVRDAASGKLQCYVISPHMAGFIRLPEASFEVTARVGERTETLVFKPVANPATGETVGDTSQFEAQADWLKMTATFGAELKRLEVKGKKYQAVSFRFPEGNYPRAGKH